MTETKILPLLTWRRAIAESRLPATSKLVALALSLWMNERGGSAFPGATLLAADTSLSVKAVRGHLSALVAAGWLEVVERGGMKGDRRRANAYQAAIPDIPNGGTTFPGQYPQRGNVTTLTGESDDPNGGTTFPPSLQELSNNSGNLTKHRKKRPTIEFRPTDAHCEYAAANGLSVQHELDHWIDWCEANGRTYVSMNAGFSTWLRQAVAFGRGKAIPAPTPDGPRSVLPPARVEVCPRCESSLLACRCDLADRPE